MMEQMGQMLYGWSDGMMVYGPLVSVLSVVVLALVALWLFQRVTRRAPV